MNVTLMQAPEKPYRDERTLVDARGDNDFKFKVRGLISSTAPVW